MGAECAVFVGVCGVWVFVGVSCVWCGVGVCGCVLCVVWSG